MRAKRGHLVQASHTHTHTRTRLEGRFDHTYSCVRAVWHHELPYAWHTRWHCPTWVNTRRRGVAGSSSRSMYRLHVHGVMSGTSPHLGQWHMLHPTFPSHAVAIRDTLLNRYALVRDVSPLPTLCKPCLFLYGWNLFLTVCDDLGNRMHV